MLYQIVSAKTVRENARRALYGRLCGAPKGGGPSPPRALSFDVQQLYRKSGFGFYTGKKLFSSFWQEGF